MIIFYTLLFWLLVATIFGLLVLYLVLVANNDPNQNIIIYIDSALLGLLCIIVVIMFLSKPQIIG